MSLEAYTGKIKDLVVTNPTGSDPRSQGDDHLRGIKLTMFNDAVRKSGGNTLTETLALTTNTSTDAVRITQTGTGNALVVEDEANPDATSFIINREGVVLKGLTTARTNTINGFSATFQLEGAATNERIVSFVGRGAEGQLVVGRQNGTTNGANNIVSNGDPLGTIVFSGADGTGLVRAAAINAAVDGTPGTNDMPGRLTFSTTADGSATPTERMRIASTGALGLSGANYGTAGQVLASSGSGAPPVWAAPPLGVGQTWSNPVRVLGTTYTNSTGRPIQINVSVAINAIGFRISLQINGLTVAYSTLTIEANQVVTISGIVIPDGATYLVTQNGGTPTLDFWTELS
jgi:hypothetical protein